MVYFDTTDGWIAYLSNHVIDACLKRCVELCAGCRDCKAAPISHTHLQLGLHDKIGYYFEDVRNDIINKIDQLYLSYTYQLSQTPGNTSIIEIGVNFLNTTTPFDIYYGNYKPGFNERYLELVYKTTLCPTVTDTPQQPTNLVKNQKPTRVPGIKKTRKKPVKKLKTELPSMERLSPLQNNI